MKIAVVGAGRRRNGIGAYIARFMHAEGVSIVAVLAQDGASAHQDAAGLREYGITAEPYGDMEMLIDQHHPDAFVIASPAVTHADYCARAVAAGSHVLCEKPFAWDNGCDIQQVSEILDSARERGLIIGMNSQWPFVLPTYEQLCGLPPVAQVELQAEPDSHQALFVYVSKHGRCQVRAELVHETSQPRSFAFGFNGRIARRTIDMATYRIAFTSGDQRCEVDDPLQLSVRDFLHACSNSVSPQINCEHIVDTMKMLQQVYTAWPAEKT